MSTVYGFNNTIEAKSGCSVDKACLDLPLNGWDTWVSCPTLDKFLISAIRSAKSDFQNSPRTVCVMNFKSVIALMFCGVFQGCAAPSGGLDAKIGDVDKHSRTVLVEGEGPTVDKAREAAIKNAIDKVAGSLVLSDQSVSNGKLIRNEVSTHRSAYVTETELVETTQAGPKRYRIQLWAKVTASQLFSRSIPIPAGSQALDGTAVAEQLKAALAFREEGDRMLQKAIEAYPVNAFQVTVDHGSVALDEHRDSQLNIRIRVEWRPLFLDALHEAASMLAVDRSHCNLLTASLLQPQNEWDRTPPADRYGKRLPVTGLCGEYADLSIIRREPGKTLPQVYGYSFGDVPRLSMVGKKLSAPLHLQLSLESENGRDADRFCESIGNHPLVSIRAGIWAHRFRQDDDALTRAELRQHEAWALNWPLKIINLEKFRRIKRIAAKVVAKC